MVRFYATVKFLDIELDYSSYPLYENFGDEIVRIYWYKKTIRFSRGDD